jgi:hypothetical protein
MTTSDLKKELKTLISQENIPNTLEAIKTLLINSSLNPVLKQKLSSRALKSEEDIKANIVYTKEEFEKKLDDILDK